MDKNLLRKAAASSCFMLCIVCTCVRPADAQLLKWLQRQVGGSNGNYGINQGGQQQYNGGNQPVVGYNQGYYQPVQDAPNPLTGMNKEFVQNEFIAPPDVRVNGYITYKRTNTGKANKLAGQAEESIEQGDYLDAENTLWNAYQYDRANAEVLNDLGVVCDRLNHQNAALTYYKMAATISPNFAQAYYNAGLDEYSYAGPIPGFPLLVQALRLDGSHPDWWYWIGNDKVITGQYSDGLYYYTQAIKLDSKYAEAYHWRGVLELRLGDDPQGHADLQRARSLDPALGPIIAEAVNSIMKARRIEKEIEEAQARAAAQQREGVQEARSYYLNHERTIQAVVSEGPRYYAAVYNQAREEGESSEQASEAEANARDQYNKDVALQAAWENSDYSEMDRINSGDASQEEIENYNPDESPTSNAGDGGGGSSYSDAGEPETSAPVEEAPAAEDSGGDN